MKIAGKTAAEIFDSVRLLAQSGGLAPGQALPPVRELAVALDVNRNTVATAYRRLVHAGIALSQGRLGTLIRPQESPVEQEGSLPGSPLADLASGNPATAWLPDLPAALARRAYRPRLYGEAPVNPGLEAYARAWLGADCADDCCIDLTHGAVDAIERLLAAHLVPGDKVAVEHPCFLSSISTLRVAGLQAVGVPVDAEGMRPEALEDALAQGVQAVIVTPRAHNPTGCSLSTRRARALRQLLARHPHVLVIVDDHFAMLSEVPYHTVIPASAQRWALIRSLSKALGPDLRLAFVASDAQTSRRLRLRLACGTHWVSHLLQDIVEACLVAPDFTARIAQARHDYTRRREALATALARQGIAPLPGADGLNLWLPLQRDGQPVAYALARLGWLVRNGEAFGVQTPAQGLRITTATLDEDQAQRLALDLKRCLG
ncbi:MocR-like B6 salvage transcription factor PtsJ [Chitiniphilus eburneus]|uniref:Putative 8-amino-7-oxononanoate synthase n=1 Tax=Chitiniphilus eburneus TaxID=2571148 RepID=A0A4U0Q0Y1_9NEIS|nr:transcriptional regulator PtsJ [Chitiniphilus eburneus]TJZ74250.1 transcriptional regulator PtsJ [Chitiniphilus eburneus]